MKCTALVAVAFISFVAGDGAWKENYEYKYKVTSRNLNATTSNNWNGIISRAHLSIFAQSTDLLIGKIVDAEYAEVEFADRWDSELDERKLSTLSFQQWSLRQPFQIHLRNGLIYSLSVDSSTTNAQLKQLKIIVNQLQVNTNDRSERDNLNDIHKTKEQSLLGNCETFYDISPIAEYLTKSNPDLVPLPELKGDGEFFGISKTRNYSNCDERMDSSNTNNFEDNSTPSEVSYFVLSGSLKRYIIQSSTTTTKVTETRNRRQLKSVLYVRASLESVEQNNRRPQFQSRDLVRTGMSVYADTASSELDTSDPSVASVLQFSDVEPSLASAAVRFKNAYIQNVETGSCITIRKDKNLTPLFASKCNCNSLQLWKTTNGENVGSVLATYGYIDLLNGRPGNGETVGNYGLTGYKWQKWTFQEGTDGSYTVINQHTRKCLYEGPGGRITQWDCNGRDTTQKWKVVENPCGEPPKLPIERFQLQNPSTGKCAVILNDSNSHFAKVVSRTCSCTNNYHFWILRIMTLINQGRTKQCMANWEEHGYDGITQCTCAYDPLHNWGFVYVDVGIFIIVTSIDGRCVQVTGNSENAPLRYVKCDLTDRTQWWRIYDGCNYRPFAADDSQ